jgi:hypothetical protein
VTALVVARVEVGVMARVATARGRAVGREMEARVEVRGGLVVERVRVVGQGMEVMAKVEAAKVVVEKVRVG